MQFKVDISKQSEQLLENTLDSQALKTKLQIGIKKVAFDWYQRIILRNPVDSSKNRGPLRSRSAWKIKALNSGFTYHITNNVKYVPVLEYGRFKGRGPKITSKGFSTQAPEGMVRVTLNEVTPYIKYWVLKDLFKP